MFHVLINKSSNNRRCFIFNQSRNLKKIFRRREIVSVRFYSDTVSLDRNLKKKIDYRVNFFGPGHLASQDQ